MKTRFLLTLALAATLPVISVSRAADEKKMPECTMSADGKLTTSDGKPMEGCTLMKDGKMHMVHGGKMMAMTTEMTMADGSKCLPDGTCVMKDGTKHKFTDGDVMDATGIMWRIKGVKPAGK